MTYGTMPEEISLEHDIDAVLGLTRADGADGSSLLDEAAPITATDVQPEDEGEEEEAPSQDDEED